MEDQKYLLEMKQISKSFGPVEVLHGVDFKVQTSSVHVLMGENGAGKSTLMKMLSGEEKPTEGTIVYEGKEVVFSHPSQARDAQIAMIHQELTPIYDMTVAENLFLGKIPARLGGLKIDYAKLYQMSQEILDSVMLDVSPKDKMSRLTVAQIQMVEIAKAVYQKAKIIIMDEPTSSISDKEVEILFQMIGRLKKQGIAIIYISHKMDEIYQIGDEVTILRDGGLVGHYPLKEITKQELIEKMVDRPMDEIYPDRESSIGDVVLKVEELSSDHWFKNISFELHKGEILGIGGLMGAGRTEVVETIFGILPKTSGKIFINGKEVKNHSPKQVIAEGIGLITDDRKKKGLVFARDIAQNVIMADYKSVSKAGILNYRKVREKASEKVKELSLKMSGLNQPVGTLSGGNQQKVVLAKWMLKNPDILIFDEPTRGIDVGSKQEFYNLINELAKEGKSIIFISSEMQEVIGMCDRVIVLCEGHLTGELSTEEITQVNIMALASGENRLVKEEENTYEKNSQ